MLPYIDNQDLACRQGEEGTLSLEVLILTPLPAIGTLDVHNQDVVGQLDGSFGSGLLFVFGHPYSLCGLPAFRLGHDTELGPEQVVQQGGLARGLGAEDGDEVIVEAGLGDVGLGEVVVQAGAVTRKSVGLARLARWPRLEAAGEAREDERN